MNHVILPGILTHGHRVKRIPKCAFQSASPPLASQIGSSKLQIEESYQDDVDEFFRDYARGAKMTVRAHNDNSIRNKCNPDSNRTDPKKVARLAFRLPAAGVRVPKSSRLD